MLSGSQSLLRARLHPEGGLDLAWRVPEGRQADPRLRLKSQLLEGAVLDRAREAGI